jgi:hypothetical protein
VSRLYKRVRALRRRVVAFGRPPDDAGAGLLAARGAAGGGERYQPWAALMRRAFGLDVLACPRCGGRLQLIATISDPRVIERILAHLAPAPASATPLALPSPRVPAVPS